MQSADHINVTWLFQRIFAQEEKKAVNIFIVDSRNIEWFYFLIESIKQ